ncbi:LCP family protein required for cell wall assembly [Bacillus mesophilus]|uniref:LytR family transcriptional regulator n=1 Tax=Bacillus mesophilus TaxID=1808955 RepID=A0A6M0Q7L7_9BACI|nr:LCP family protein [Bacillus mesophilus]MBM7661604.1 LCP family protein required for cell wall assembly [Bacillus mesophilus]NEY72273.1 LytR family transcriptional regulator [Bacillus mesophilus]
MTNNRADKLFDKKKRRKKKVIYTILITFSIAAICLGYFLYSSYNAASNSFKDLERGDKSKKREEAVVVHKDPISILLMGLEDYSSGGKNGRTDSLVIITFNPVDKSMKMVSIPRDTYVELPGRGKDKINHAHVFGGSDLTIETVENFLDIPIDYYAKVNFEGFKEIVDEVGGISVDVPFDFWEYSDEEAYKKLYFTKGVQSLNGEEALAYVRMRSQDKQGDFGRIERQKQAVKALVSKVNNPTILFKATDIAEHVGSNVETNLKPGELVNFAGMYKNIDLNDSENLTLEGENSRINRIYYYVPKEDSLTVIQDKLKEHLNINNTN